VDPHLQPRRDEIQFAGLIFTDERLGACAAGAGLLALGYIVWDADMREMIEPGSPRGTGRRRSLRRRIGGRNRHDRRGLVEYFGDVEQVALAWGVAKAFTALAEDVAAKEGQGLGQLGVFLLQLIVVGRGLIEHALQLIDAALSILGLLLGTLGLPPQLGVAAKQVLEQPLAIA
jgi:hypothetical protein